MEPFSDAMNPDDNLISFPREFDDLLRELGLDESRSDDVTTSEVPKLPVSPIFFPDARLDGNSEDLILLSSDSICFHVSSTQLILSSNNGFGSHLPLTGAFATSDDGSLPMIRLSHVSTVINIVLHAAYNIACSELNSEFEDVELAIAAFDVYGLNVRKALSSDSPLYVTMLSFVPLRPIDVYALAAKYDLAELAARASGHLMAFKLSSLTDEMAEKIGASYLKKLFLFHIERIEAVSVPDPP